MTISFQDLKQQFTVMSSTNKNTVQTNNTQSVKTPKTKENRDSHKLLLALGGLAVLGSGALLVYNSLKKGKIASTNNYSLERIDKFIKRLPAELKMSWQNRIKKLPLDKSEFVKALVNKKQDILPLEYLFKLKELRLNNVPDLPPLINLENIQPEKAKNITQILSGKYKTAYSSTKYTNGFMEEFFGTLTKISQSAKENYKNNKQYTFLNIENVDTLLNDLSKPNNEEYLNKFRELIASNANNRLIYVTNGQNKELESLQHMKLAFTDEIKTIDLADDLADFSSLQSDIESIKHDKIMESLSDYLDNSIVQTLNHFAWKQNKSNILFFDNATSKTTNQFLEKLKTIVDDKFVNIDANKEGFAKLNEYILAELPKAKDLYNRENKYTYFYLDGLEDLVSKTEKDSEDFIKFKEIIKNSIEDSNLRLIIKNEKQNDVLNSLKSNGTLSLKFFKNPEFSKLYAETRAKIDQCDFSYIDKDDFIYQYVNLFVAEKSGLHAFGPSGNGILIYGASDKTKVIANSIKKSLDVNYKEYDFLENGNTDMLKAVFDLKKILKASELEYQKTGKRTIVEVHNLDELLTRETTRKDVITIAHFKSFAELASEKYHTTILMRTDKPLENFESASISCGRFPIKLKIKEQ